MVEIELKSKELKEFVYLKLNKDRHLPIYDEDVERIKDVTLNGLDFLDEPTDATIFDLVFFKNLRSCIIVNMIITENEIDVLNRQNNLESIQFTNCLFPKDKKVCIATESLILDKCKELDMSAFSEMDSLENLKIVNCEKIKVDGIDKLSAIKKLYMQGLEVDDISLVSNLKNLEYINLNGSNIKSIPEDIKNNPRIKYVHEERNFMYDVEE